MTEYNSLYLDTAPIIYALESVEPYTQNVQDFLILAFREQLHFHFLRNHERRISRVSVPESGFSENNGIRLVQGNSEHKNDSRR